MPQSKVKNFFRSAFGTDPLVITRAPGRVEVLGNHTDYNEGYVLSCAIDKEISLAAARSPGPIELCSTQFEGKVSVRKPLRQRTNAWANYPLGVYNVLRQNGFACEPFVAAVHGTIPPGAGLSSSAALEVATAFALQSLYKLDIDPESLARFCQQAENEFVGAKCGLLDQFSSVFGKKSHALFIDFRTLEHQAIPLPGPALCLAITTSGVSHSLVESEYNARRHECFEAAAFFSRGNSSVRTLRDISSSTLRSARRDLDPILYRRAMHVVGENERVLSGMRLLKKGDLKEFGELLYKSHESSRVNFENSCPELDILVEIASGAPGVYGSRLTGGGFGGATLTLVNREAATEFKRIIVKEYARRTGRLASVHFAKVADGARVIKRFRG